MQCQRILGGGLFCIMVVNILLVPVVGERTAIIIAVMFSLLVLGSMSSVVFASSFYVESRSWWILFGSC